MADQEITTIVDGLQMARGNGMNMVSLIIPPDDQLPRVSEMLADEFYAAVCGKAANEKAANVKEVNEKAANAKAANEKSANVKASTSKSANIKSYVNILSALGAITSVQQRLKLYAQVPANGLVIYCGSIITKEGDEKKINIDFEPSKPVKSFLYLRDNKFHLEALIAHLADDSSQEETQEPLQKLTDVSMSIYAC